VSSDERARLFVALELPAFVRKALAAWRGSPARLRLIRPEDLHVTLCFLGWQPVSSADAVLAACGLVSGRPAAPLRVVEAIWLPPRRPRVLAVRLEDVAGALTAVQGELAAALAEGGWYVPEKRPFLAHVTVARVGRDGRVRRGLEAPPELSFEGSRVTLFRSRLSPAGARYEPLGTVSLG
jgi:2'-5' RNA ligase